MTSLLIVDAQSVKNADSARNKGYDADKKVSGIKRHIAVDTPGLPHAIAVTTSDVTDRKGALLAFGRCEADLTAVQSILADGGYFGQPFADAAEELLGAQVKIANRSESHTFAVMPQRWVVEGSTNAAIYGRTASANSTPACSSSIWPCWPFCSSRS